MLLLTMPPVHNRLYFNLQQMFVPVYSSTPVWYSIAVCDRIHSTATLCLHVRGIGLIRPEIEEYGNDPDSSGVKLLNPVVSFLARSHSR